jgi:hypothetical protein
MKRVASLLSVCLVALLAVVTCASRSEPSGSSRGPGVRKTELPTSERHAVFERGLKNRWQDWGWAPRELKDGQAARLDMSNFGGWILARPGVRSPAYEALSLRFKAPQQAGDFLEVRLGTKEEGGFPAVRVGAAHRRTTSDGWEEVLLHISALNPRGKRFDRVIIRAHKRIPRGWVELDDIVFWGGGAQPAADARAPAQAFATRPARFSIDCEAASTPISDEIYGIAFHMQNDRKDRYLWELRPSGRRWGGNANSRYNWKLGNAWNTANDWYFRNVDYGVGSGWSWRVFLDVNRERGARTALTLPLVGWVAKDTETYSFPVDHLGAQQFTDPALPNAGNGRSPDGKELAGPPPTQTSVEASPAFVLDWVREIKKREGEGGRSVHVWILGNEPMLWHDTHRDVHPEPTTYDELLQKTVAVAREIRRIDPEGEIAGPAVWGWPAYFYSAADQAVSIRLRPDRRRHGDVPLLEWWLGELKKHEDRTGERLLDLLDVHFYPQGAFNDKVDDETVAFRLRATRSLWDPSYVEETWIKQPVRLIPRMKELIAKSYPGTRLMIGEYNMGAEGDMSGALALAETLGRFGRHGVDAAYYWTYPPEDSPAAWAFRAYRNYDGQGSHFGDRALAVEAPADTSLFASRVTGQDRVVAVLVNPSLETGLDARIALKGCGAPSKARAFSLTERGARLQQTDVALPDGWPQLAVAPWSVTVVELSPR